RGTQNPYIYVIHMQTTKYVHFGSVITLVIFLFIIIFSSIKRRVTVFSKYCLHRSLYFSNHKISITSLMKYISIKSQQQDGSYTKFGFRSNRVQQEHRRRPR
ncbi:hypothetical protein PanWU01x14_292720, partial [Parasponia andersonii]